MPLTGYSKLASVPAGGAVAVAASGAPAAGGAAAPAGKCVFYTPDLYTTSRYCSQSAISCFRPE